MSDTNGLTPFAKLLGLRGDDLENGRIAVADHSSRMMRIEDYLRQTAESSTRRPDVFEWQASGVAPGATNFTVGSDQIPVGKRLVIYRIITTAPAGSGSYTLYAGAIASDNIRYVIGTPQLAMSESARGLVIHGGQRITSVIVGATAGQCTVRIEGDLFDEEPDRSSDY